MTVPRLMSSGRRRALLSQKGVATTICPSCGHVTEAPQALDPGAALAFSCDVCDAALVFVGSVYKAEDFEAEEVIEGTADPPGDYITKAEVCRLISDSEATVLELIQGVEERWITLAQAQWEASPPAKPELPTRPKRQNQR